MRETRLSSILLLVLLLALIVPTAFAQNSLQPWATVDNNGQITFNPNGLTPTGRLCWAGVSHLGTARWKMCLSS